jgi:hypothetical protein
MSEPDKQGEAADHIKQLLIKAGYSISPRKISLEHNRHWFVFEYKQRQIGIDSESGIWVRESSVDAWRCIAMPCTVSGALQAVETLIGN